jgi:hypothetical protein
MEATTRSPEPASSRDEGEQPAAVSTRSAATAAVEISLIGAWARRRWRRETAKDMVFSLETGGGARP